MMLDSIPVASQLSPKINKLFRVVQYASMHGVFSIATLPDQWQDQSITGLVQSLLFPGFNLTIT